MAFSRWLELHRRDWADSPLGEPESWPPALRMALEGLRAAPGPALLLWGEEGFFFYNMAGAPLLGAAHPAAFGRPLAAAGPLAEALLAPVLHHLREGRAVPALPGLRAVPLAGEGGGVAGMLCHMAAPAPRGAAPPAEEGATRLRAVLDSMGEAFVLLDPALRVCDINAEALRRDGRPRAALIGLSITEAWPDLPQVAPLCRRVLATRRGGGIELEHRFLSGREGVFELRAFPVEEGVALFCRDISARRRAEEMLREEQRMLETLNRTGAALGGELEPRRLVQMVTDAAVALCGARYGAFFYRETDGTGQDYILYALSGAPAEAFAHFPLPRETALFSPTFRAEGVVRCDDVRLDPRYSGALPPGHLPVCSYMAVPVVSRGGGSLGGLFFAHDEPARFTARHERMLVGLAGQAAVALDNARLYQAAQRELAVRRTAEEALRVSEERFRVIADAVDQMIWSTGPEGEADYFNQRWYDYTGLPSGSTHGDAWLAAFHPEDRAHTRRLWLDCVTTGAPYEVEYRLRHHSGEYRWVIGRALPLLGENGVIRRWYGTCTDVHALKLAEAALRDLTATLEQRVADAVAERVRAEETLRQVQKMEAVGQLSGGLAHDFNNLLTGILGALELLRQRLEQGRPEEAARYITAAQGAARRAAALTQRLLAFARRQTLDPRPTDVNRLVAGMEELIRRTVGPQVEIVVRADPAAWAVLVDANQLENALLNLCINARDAMPRGGRIEIETANQELGMMAARAADLPPGPYLMLGVRDSGTGMTPEVAARAFDPFFTTKPLGEGTGLGLSMVYGFVRQSGGQVRIHTAPGEGTALRLYLPRHGDAAAVAAEAEPAPRAAMPAAPGCTVLVVEDEPSVRMLMVDVLQALGHVALEAADGAAALCLFDSLRPVDLMISDVGLPGGMNGRQLAEAARGRQPGLPVLLVTGYAESMVTGQGQLPPGVQLLTKPFTMDLLAERVQALLAMRGAAGRNAGAGEGVARC
ncbi:PAS domain S-box protein [Roseomonas sp. GC11]|uniref:PAS domain S-box protein n=1 Tax=Roseomonas sp. GC11 TaxID=2950546 RepID=UPI00210C6C1C|nr:PAS domain S-box protein [Roseomonas sp. GC11]MCQ4162589.1 PAS domain S-box protein [Roseomonas sp. GC11]